MSSFSYTLQEYAKDRSISKEISAIREIPLTIYLNEREVITLLCTAKFPLYLAIGFLKSDAYITKLEQIVSTHVEEDDYSIKVLVETNNDPWKERTQHLSITSGCGKGTNFERNLETISKKEIKTELKLKPQVILKHVAELFNRSSLYRQTRGCHNSSLCSTDEMLFFREDIGRHNAIDTIVGECFYNDIGTQDKIIVSTGRITSEILLKAVRIGVPALVSTAVATSLSIELARKIGLTLVGNVNIEKESFWIYNDSNKLLDF